MPANLDSSDVHEHVNDDAYDNVCDHEENPTINASKGVVVIVDVLVHVGTASCWNRCPSVPQLCSD
jgi:hypothetical protein